MGMVRVISSTLLRLMCFYYVLVAIAALSSKVLLQMPSNSPSRPQLILISGATGTGKSTLGMSLALNQGILRCLSTDSIRQVLRAHSNDSALHRSSYSGQDDPIEQWTESCKVIDSSIDSLVHDALQRGISLVIEGVHVVPRNHVLNVWKQAGGVAVGCALTITDENAHRSLISKRAQMTNRSAEAQMAAFRRIRQIQEEIVRRAKQHNWLVIEQRIEADPIEQIAGKLAS